MNCVHTRKWWEFTVRSSQNVQGQVCDLKLFLKYGGVQEIAAAPLDHLRRGRSAGGTVLDLCSFTGYEEEDHGLILLRLAQDQERLTPVCSILYRCLSVQRRVMR